MFRMTFLFLAPSLIVAIAGCSPALPSPSTSGTGADGAETVKEPARGAQGADAATKYRVGDFVEYRYAGISLKAPVYLIERVAEQEGNRLRIEVEARRGNDSLRWVQVVTDTPENQKNEVIDELYEIRDGKPIRLENKDNRDIYRLYSWTIPPLNAKPKHVGTETQELSVAGRSFECSVEKSELAQEARKLSLEFASCKTFLWTNGPAEIRNVETGEVFWSRQVVAFGGPGSQSDCPCHQQ